MARGDLYVQAVESIYACGSGEGLVSVALSATSRLLGAAGATYEVIDKTTGLQWFSSAGLPSAAGKQYSDHFATHNPRVKPVLNQRAGEVCWDYKLMDEEAMKRDAFYSEFLPSMGLRYFISAVLEQTSDRIAVVSVQRSQRKGHADQREIALMHRLCPHFQRAYSMRKLLGVNAPSLFEDALDLLADGIALLRRDGRILHVHEALRNIAARNPVFRICRDSIEFSTPELRDRFASALGATQRMHDPNAAYLATDFAVP